MKLLRKEFLVLLTPMIFQMVIAMVALMVLGQIEGQLREDHQKKRVALMLHEVEQLHGECLASAFFYGVTENAELKRMHQRAKGKLEARLSSLENSIASIDSKAGASVDAEIDLPKLKGTIDRSFSLQNELMKKNLMSLWDKSITVGATPVSSQLVIDTTVQALSSPGAGSGHSLSNAFAPIDGDVDPFIRGGTFSKALSQAAGEAGLFLLFAGITTVVMSAVTAWIMSSKVTGRLRSVKENLGDLALGKEFERLASGGDDELARIEMSINDSILKIAELNRFKQDAVNTVSHDLRAPLTSIAGFIALAGDGSFGSLGDEDERMLVEALDLVGQVKMLVNLILDWEKVNSSMIQPQPQRYEVSELFEALGERLKETGSVFKLEFSGEFFEVEFEEDLELLSSSIFYLALGLALDHSDMYGESNRNSKKIIQIGLVEEDLVLEIRVMPESIESAADLKDSAKDEDGSGYLSTLALRCGHALLRSQEIVAYESQKAEEVDSFRIPLASSPGDHLRGWQPVASIKASGNGSEITREDSLRESLAGKARRKPAFPLESKMILLVMMPCLVLLGTIFSLGYVLKDAQKELAGEYRARQILFHANALTGDIANVTVSAVLQSMTGREDLTGRRKRLMVDAEKSLASIENLIGKNPSEWERALTANLKGKISRSYEIQDRLAFADAAGIVEMSEIYTTNKSGRWKDAFGFITRPLITKFGLTRSSSLELERMASKIRILLVCSTLASVVVTVVSILLARNFFTEPMRRLELLAGGQGNDAECIGRNIREVDDEFSILGNFLLDCRKAIEYQESERSQLISFLSEALSGRLTKIRRCLILLMETSQSLSEKGRHRFALSVSELWRLESMVGDFVDLDALERGVLVARSEPVDMKEIAEVVRDAIQPQAALSSVLIEVVCEQAARAQGDREKLNQVLFNLVHNAVKYSPSGSTVTILIENIGRELEASVQNSETVRVSVSDMGPGIAEEDQLSVFERFKSVDDDGAKTRKGYGIGLYIAASLINAQGGAIGVESELDRGSCFWFELSSV